MTRKQVTESSGNIFLDMGFPPHEAEVMLLRATLAEALRDWIEREELTQAEASKRLALLSRVFPRLRAARSNCCRSITWSGYA
jgi:predicted XRE-type DNA-binding protein